jgi:hypothetical protein
LRSLRGARERSPVWWASALGIVLVPVLLETSSYYTSFLALAVVLAHERRHVIAVPVLGAIAGCLVARLAGLVNDVFYAVASALVVVANGAVLVLVTRATRPAEEEPPA